MHLARRVTCLDKSCASENANYLGTEVEVASGGYLPNPAANRDAIFFPSCSEVNSKEYTEFD